MNLWLYCSTGYSYDWNVVEIQKTMHRTTPMVKLASKSFMKFRRIFFIHRHKPKWQMIPVQHQVDERHTRKWEFERTALTSWGPPSLQVPMFLLSTSSRIYLDEGSLREMDLLRSFQTRANVPIFFGGTSASSQTQTNNRSYVDF